MVACSALCLDSANGEPLRGQYEVVQKRALHTERATALSFHDVIADNIILKAASLQMCNAGLEFKTPQELEANYKDGIAALSIFFDSFFKAVFPLNTTTSWLGTPVKTKLKSAWVLCTAAHEGDRSEFRLSVTCLVIHSPGISLYPPRFACSFLSRVVFSVLEPVQRSGCLPSSGPAVERYDRLLLEFPSLTDRQRVQCM
jgi:hypothetical protein